MTADAREATRARITAELICFTESDAPTWREWAFRTRRRTLFTALAAVATVGTFVAWLCSIYVLAAYDSSDVSALVIVTLGAIILAGLLTLWVLARRDTGSWWLVPLRLLTDADVVMYSE
jgi:hypothetical protein